MLEVYKLANHIVNDKFPEGKDQHEAARYLAEAAFTHYGFFAPFEFARDERERPYLVSWGGSNKDLLLADEKLSFLRDEDEFLEELSRENEDVGKFKGDFNISHSGDQVWMAISDGKVGIDVESLSIGRRPQSLEQMISGRFLSDREKDHMERSLEKFGLTNEFNAKFMQLWTFKESVAKALNIPVTEVLFNIDYYEMLSEGEQGKHERLFTIEWEGETYYISQRWDDEGVLSVCSQTEFWLTKSAKVLE